MQWESILLGFCLGIAGSLITFFVRYYWDRSRSKERARTLFLRIIRSYVENIKPSKRAVANMSLAQVSALHTSVYIPEINFIEMLNQNAHLLEENQFNCIAGFSFSDSMLRTFIQNLKEITFIAIDKDRLPNLEEHFPQMVSVALRFFDGTIQEGQEAIEALKKP